MKYGIGFNRSRKQPIIQQITKAGNFLNLRPSYTAIKKYLIYRFKINQVLIFD